MAEKDEGIESRAEPLVTRSEPLGFSAAMAELETILRRVESEDVDLDQLASELARAAELLESCRAKLRRAEAEVGQVLQQLEPPGEG
jgi:exodeoxyribonuclease VII small subunit